MRSSYHMHSYRYHDCVLLEVEVVCTGAVSMEDRDLVCSIHPIVRAAINHAVAAVAVPIHNSDDYSAAGGNDGGVSRDHEVNGPDIAVREASEVPLLHLCELVTCPWLSVQHSAVVARVRCPEHELPAEVEEERDGAIVIIRLICNEALHLHYRSVRAAALQRKRLRAGGRTNARRDCRGASSGVCCEANQE